MSSRRVWPALLVGALFMPVTVFGAGLVGGLFGLIGDTEEGLTASDFRTLMWIAAAFDVVVVAFLMALTRESVRERFRLGAWSLSLKWVPLAALGTWLAAFVGATLSMLVFGSTGEWAQQREALLVGDGGPTAPELLVLIAVLPPLVEELVFRGYVQGRLLRRMPVPVAVGLASALFASAHGELEYAVQVFPMGVWFGTVAVLARSIWPAVALHAVQNGVAVTVMILTSGGPAAAAAGASGGGGLDGPTRVGVFLIFGVPAAVVLMLLGRFLASRVEREARLPLQPPVRPI